MPIMTTKMKTMMTMAVLQDPDRRNDHHEDKDENNDDNGGVAGPRWTRLHHSTLLWSVLLPWQVWSCPFFLIIIEMIILAMRMNSLKEYF